VSADGLVSAHPSGAAAAAPPAGAIERQFRFAFFDKWNSFRYVFLISKIFVLLLLRRRDYGNYCDCLQFLTSEEPRHTHMRERLVDRYTPSKSTRPNRFRKS
jgi:hypothetical protein